jgi:hypothetical protein
MLQRVVNKSVAESIFVLCLHPIMERERKSGPSFGSPVEKVLRTILLFYSVSHRGAVAGYED